MKLFHYDMLRFDSNEESRYQLEVEPLAPYFMTSTYFDESQQRYLLDFPTSTGLCCKEYLDVLLDRKIKDQGDLTILCTSHDLAPAIAKVFKIRKGYESEKLFQKFVKMFKKMKA